jgi:hypothetical protein
MSARFDPELAHQIDEAAADESIGAVIRLGSTSASSPAPSPEETERIAHELLARAQERARSGPPDYKVFTHLGYFVVSAPPAFLRALVAEPEVIYAFPNRRQSSVA